MLPKHQEEDEAYGRRVGMGLVLLGVGSYLLPLFGLQFIFLVWIDAMGPMGHVIRLGLIAGGAWVVYAESLPKEPPPPHESLL